MQGWWSIFKWEWNEREYIYSNEQINGNKHSHTVNLDSIKWMKQNKL